MANDGINITFAEVSSTAQSIKTINGSLSARLAEIKREMENLKNTWQSDASDAIQRKFSELVPRFQEHETIIKSYADFLEKTVTSYETNETTTKNKAENASLFK